MAASSLARRVATALALLPVVLVPLFLLPPAGWALFVLAVMFLAAVEWARLCGCGTSVTMLFAGALVALGVVLLFATPPVTPRGFPDVVVYVICGAAALFWMLIAPGWLARQGPAGGRFAKAAVGLIVLLATFVGVVELQAHSPWLLLAAMAVVWIADTAAYFAGRAFGKRKLAPTISPGKTWEGVWGALLAVAVYALVLAVFTPRSVLPAPSTLPAIVLFVAGTMLLAGFSVVGDLYESLLKRQAGVKDSGSLLPGHGGVLDRVDALLAFMPLAALALTLWLPQGSQP